MSPLTFSRSLSRLLGGVVLVCVAWGGGLGVESARAAQSLIVTTTVADAGGGILNSGGKLLLDSCTFVGNRSEYSGGAIYSETDLSGVTLTIRNCTLAVNWAGEVGNGGHAIHNSAGLTVIESSTIVANGIGGTRGAVYSTPGPNTRTEVRNSIISGNTLIDVDSTGGAGNSFQSQGYNLIGGGVGLDAFNQTNDVTGNSDPGLATLAENGGRTPTCAVLPFSPARDTGNTNLSVDQRGVLRPQPAGYPADKGAFELTPTESLVVTTTADEDNGTSDPFYGAGTSLREAINRATTDGAASVITFDPVAFAAPRKTITLGGTQLPDIVESNSLTITAPAAGVEISGNQASRIFSVTSGAVVTLEGLTLRDGRLTHPVTGVGGAIRCAGRLVADACTFIGNEAYQGGAIMLDGQDSWDRLSLTLRNCTLWGNRATQRGNAICNLRGVVSIESSTITGNVGSAPSALWASGTINQPAQFQLHNSIASGNGIRDIDGSGADVSGIPHYYAYPFISDGFNLIGTGGSGDGSTSAFDKTGDAVIGNGSPGLGPLQDNGGRTFTHAVLLGSPALNTGSSSLGTDQRGLSRALGGVRDKGAYELQPETYAFWSGHTFPFGTPAPLLAPGADYDGDGILNGIEHATGRNPLVPDLGGAVTLFQIQGANLVLQFERSILADPAKISIEQSPDLAAWSTLGITLQNLGPATPTTELIQALIPTGGAPRKFGRLRYGP